MVGAVRPSTVRQQGDRELAVRIEPQRGARVAEVAEGARTKIFSGLRGRGRSIPAEGAGGASRSGFAAGEEGDGFGAEDGLSSVEHDVGDTGKVFGCGEQASVA